MSDQVDSSSLGRARPIRTCVGCRQRVPQAELLRVVAVTVSAGLLARPDQRNRQPGRGAYLHPSLRCIELAERRRALPRALRLTAALDMTLVRLEIDGMHYP